MRNSGLGAVVACLCVLAASQALAEVPPRGVGKCETGKSSADYGRWFWLGPEFGGENYRTTATVTNCSGTNQRFYRWGLYGPVQPGSQTRGQLVPDRYDAVAPYSQTAALVKREDGRWANYQFGKGEIGGVLPQPEVVIMPGEPDCEVGRKTTERRPGTTAVALSALGPDGRRTAYPYSAEGQPTPIPGLGGSGVDTPIERHGNVLIGRWSDPADGKIHHRLYSLGGKPLSPVLGEIERWTTVTKPSDRNQRRVCARTESIDLFAVGPSLDQDRAGFWGSLLTPIGAEGVPLGLPAGAIGVAAVPSTWRDRTPVMQAGFFAPFPVTRVWAVIYAAADGFEFTLHEGPVAQALTASPAAERFVALERSTTAQDAWAFGQMDSALLYGRTRTGEWKGRGYFREDVQGTPARSLQQAANSARMALQTAVAQDQAAAQAAEARKTADMLAAFDARFTGGDPCQFAPPWNLDQSRIVRHAERCPHLYNANDLQRMITSNFPPSAIGAVKTNRAVTAEREQIARAEQAEAARNYVPPGAWEGALRAASDAQLRNIKQSGENWLQQRQRQYEADWQRSQRGY